MEAKDVYKYCEKCLYHYFIHTMKDLPERCKDCPRPMTERLAGHGIYQGLGGIQVED